MNFITAYENLSKSLVHNNCKTLREDFKIFEDLCLEDQLYLSAEICNMMTLSFGVTSHPSWKIVLDLCSENIEMDDFSVQMPYMASQQKWWLIEEILNRGVDLDISSPDICRALIACAPLEIVQQSLSQQQKAIFPIDAILSVNNPDHRVFNLFLNMFSPQMIKDTLQAQSKGVRVSGVLFSLVEHPWVTSALEKRLIADSLKTQTVRLGPHRKM